MKPKTKLYIEIPEPCNKGWENMTPDGQGRHCDRCEKTVIDFTGMTDNELVQFFVNAKGKPFCGHYLQTQLNREITLTTPSKQYFHIRLGKKIAAGLLLLQALANDTWAQVRKPAAATVSVPEEKNKQHKPLALRGRFTDLVTKMPIPDITITIKGTDFKGITDSDGWFAIPVSDTDSLPVKINFTAHYNQKNEPPGTAIRNERYTLTDMLNRKMLNIYRYPADSLDDIVITNYRVPLVDGYKPGGHITYTGERINEMPTRKWPIVDTLNNIFRKKKK